MEGKKKKMVRIANLKLQWGNNWEKNKWKKKKKKKSEEEVDAADFSF